MSSYWISAPPPRPPPLLLIPVEWRVFNRAMAGLHPKEQTAKQLASLALETLVGCQHGSLGEILLEEYFSQ